MRQTVIKRILLLTNAERGRANVFLATGHVLLEQGYEVHLASFPAIKEYVTTSLPDARFHELEGKDRRQAWTPEEMEHMDNQCRRRKPNVYSMVIFLRYCLRTIFAWSGRDFMIVWRSTLEILQEVSPDMVVVDPALSPAMTACGTFGQRFVVLAPNTIKDFAFTAQPVWDRFCRYPCLASGIPYPVPWYLVPLNIYYMVVSVILCIFDARTQDVARYVRSQIGSRVWSLINLPPDVKYLVANRPEIEYPLKVIPPHIVPCGPIVRPAAPVAEADPELAIWLSRGPTIYINLGTQVKTALQGALEIAQALRIVLDHAKQGGGYMEDLQVLWKLNKHNFSGDEAIREVLGEEMENDTVRVVDWVKPEPPAILEHGNVVAVVNHGGANSFMEAVAAGKPQVVLPVWMDGFDFANRAELLGIGVWGNRKTTGRYDLSELGPALIKVLLGQEAEDIKAEARRLAEFCNEIPGRLVAAKTIVAEMDEE